MNIKINRCIIFYKLNQVWKKKWFQLWYPGPGLATPLGVTDSSDTTDDNPGNQLKISFYYPVLDSMLSELSRRFSVEVLEIMRAVQCCNPSSESFLDPAANNKAVQSPFW